MKFVEIFIFFATSALLVKCQLDSLTELEQTIITNITKEYNRVVRPEDIIYVKYILSIKQIVSIDEKNQIMTSSSNIIAYWKDFRLTWDSTNYGEIKRVLIPANRLWLPDLIIVNSADSDVFIKINDQIYALIESNGWVNLIYSAVNLRTRCEIDVKRFPFDKQKVF
jgi:hypothetical protein